MTAIFQTNQPTTGKTAIRFTYSADTAKLQAIVGNFAQMLHSRGAGPVDGNGKQIPFATLTNQQKLDIIDQHLLNEMVSGAKRHRASIATKAAQEGVESTPEQDKFD